MPAERGLSPQDRWLFATLALLAVATILPEVRSANDASRMALTQSLVEHRSLIIDQSVFVQWEDKSWVNGHFYSDKPALPSLLAAVVYWPIHALGIKLDFGVNFAYFLIVLFVSKASWLGGAFAFYKGLRFVDVPESGRLGATLALGDVAGQLVGRRRPGAERQRRRGVPVDVGGSEDAPGDLGAVAGGHQDAVAVAVLGIAGIEVVQGAVRHELDRHDPHGGQFRCL